MAAADTVWAGVRPARFGGKNNHFVIDAVVSLDACSLQTVVDALQSAWVGRFPERFTYRRTSVAGMPVLRPCDSFHMTNHVQLMPGLDDASQVITEADLQAHIAASSAQALDPGKPGWLVHFVPAFQLRNGQVGSALYLRIDHSLVDGVALVRMLLEHLADASDQNSTPASTGLRRNKSQQAYPPFPLPHWQIAARAAALLPFEACRALGDCSDQHRMKGQQPFTGQRAVAWAHVAHVADVKSVAAALCKAWGTKITFNDVMLGVLGSATRQCLLKQACQDGGYALPDLPPSEQAVSPDTQLPARPVARLVCPSEVTHLRDGCMSLPLPDSKSGTPNSAHTGIDRAYIVPASVMAQLKTTAGCCGNLQWLRFLRVCMPVNVRSLNSPLRMQNDFAAVICKLCTDGVGMPGGTGWPALDAVKATSASFHAVKQSGLGLLYSILAKAVATSLPPAIAHFLADWIATHCTAVVSNVPGPAAPVHIAGARVHDIAFWAPARAGITSSMSIFSYDGDVSIGIRCDTGAMEQPDLLLREFRAEWARLQAEVRQYIITHTTLQAAAAGAASLP